MGFVHPYQVEELLSIVKYTRKQFGDPGPGELAFILYVLIGNL